ncbi:nuclear pore complex protein Nup133-like isoform X2 [Physella acuta]|uniref:nuclear pore complex protein Nup133-like isoform X2 n=1 Tax=Physella acuta TaxID=109671 RepID=UPI0027DDF6C8|nr:nuclear pore complex protein Nup133-like isoform X2 [Physella acuta]
MFSPRTPSLSNRPSPFAQPRNSRLSNTTPRRNLRNQSVLSSQSFQASQILEETPLHRIEAFGSALPVLITEALTLSDRTTTEITACIDPSGWAWLVGGRKLFVWRYKSTGASRNVHCKELTLPPSDLAHSAERVCVIPSDNDSQPAACVAVSPEGVVRYWPNIAFESSTAEISAELRGEECAKVINFQPHGCLLATTTSSLLLLVPSPGQAIIHCKPLKASQGLFSGISRRMSSFIFGASQIQTNGMPLQTILAAPVNEYDNDDDDEGEDLRSFYVLSGNNICKWQVPSIGPEKLLYQIDAERMFREALARKVWDQDSIQLPQLKTWLIDLQLTREGIVMFGAGVNLEISLNVHFALAYFETYEDSQPANVSDLIKLNYDLTYSEASEHQITSYKLIYLSSDKSNTVFIYNKNSILMLQDNYILDKMDLKTTGDMLLGAGSYGGVGVFFSNAHGIFSISPQKSELSVLDESNNQSTSRTDMTCMVSNAGKFSEMLESSDNKTKLKGAFIASISEDRDKVQSIVDEILHPARLDPSVKWAELDNVVSGVSKDLTDDYPNADPRWAESDKQDSTSSTASVIIIQQLKDKQKAHDLFVNFLKNYGIWEQLSVVGVRGSLMPTRRLLCEHVEKLEAAMALRELHADHHKIVDHCISKVLKQRRVAIPPTLTAQDMFYREVSNIHEILQLLVMYEKETLSSDQSSRNIVNLVSAVNSIFQGMLHNALKYRQQNEEYYSVDNEEIPEYIPWTATSIMRKIMTDQIGLTLDKAISVTREVDVQGSLFDNIVSLADFIMDGYSSQLKSLLLDENRQEDYMKLEREFEKERHKLILPLLNHKQYDRAASLGEKYEDFEMLMRICDVTDNQERIHKYRSQFADKGFAQFSFNWYMKEGKRGHLLSQPVSQGDELSKFLDSSNVKYLSWLHEINRGNFLAAHDTLADLARMETNFLAKKKTLLSLSKLAALAADEEEDDIQDRIEMINEELDLILHQEVLPVETIQNVGMDPNNMRVLTPVELIELYISEHNQSANEGDVKKALDLLHHIDKEGEHDYEALRLHIWCRAILMDDERTKEETDPLDSVKDKIFFKTVDLVHMDDELEQLLPELKVLMSAKELSSLTKQPHFKFLMQACYEQIQKETSMMD